MKYFVFEYILFRKKRKYYLSEQLDKMEFTHDISYLLDIFSYINEKKKLEVHQAPLGI